MTVLRSGSASDVGRVRTVNEDLALESLTLFAVADGMGGHAGGEVAARTAIETLQREFTREPSVQGLVDAVHEANRVVWDQSLDSPDLRGMGTTLTAAALVATDDGDRLVLTNVGDSRSYRFHGGELIQLTRDHSVAEELVDRGELSEDEAAIHPHRHILTRALGVSPDVDVDVWLLSPESGDRYLLCSDGLTNEVSTTRISGVLSDTADPEAASEALVRLANEHGGSDNITVVVLDVVVGDDHAAAVDGAAPVATAAPVVPGATVAAEPQDAPAVAEAQPAVSMPLPGAEGSPAGPEPEPERSRSLLGRFGGDAAGGHGHGGSARPERQRTRRITFRVVFFVLLLGAVVAGGFAIVRWYVNSSYFVQLHSGQVVVYQGRMGGFLGLQPRVAWRTGIQSAEVPASDKGYVRAGVEESSLKGACNYVLNLVSDAQLHGSAPGATPSPSGTATVSTPVLPKGCRS